MKKYLLPLLASLTAIGSPAFADQQEAPAIEKNINKEFNAMYREALSSKLGINNLNIGFITNSGTTAIIIGFDADITLRQARAILVESVETLQDLVKAHPEFQGKIPGAHSDISQIALVIDTYDDSKEKDEQFGVSSVILIDGQVSFMGISHNTGGEVLMHKQPYRNAVRMNEANIRR